jgi:crotonobetainyl-CoA:carnitine CoA-transferase CaiB-like acyl-CoA transferase
MDDPVRAWLLARGLDPAMPLGAWLADWLTGVAAAIADLAG